MLTAPSGVAEWIARHHAAVLPVVAALSGIATAVAATLTWFQPIAWLDLTALALGACLAGLVAFWQVRHTALAVLVALSPLPGLIWAAPFSDGGRFAGVPAVAYGFGYALAALYAQYVLDGLLDRAPRERPWRSAGMVLTLSAVLVPVWFSHGVTGDATLQLVCDLIGTSASVMVFMPLMVPLLHADEAFVAIANRARERRGRLFEPLSITTEPRWGLSFTGITLIFAALGWFDAPAMLLSGWWRYGLSFAIAWSLLSWFAGGWREGAALALILSVVCLAGLWWGSYGARAPLVSVDVFGAVMFAGLLAVTGARRTHLWRISGEDVQTACRRALEELSPAMFVTLGAAAVLLPWLYNVQMGLVMLDVVVAGLAGAVLFPITLTGMESMFPRRRSVDDVFAKPPE